MKQIFMIALIAVSTVASGAVNQSKPIESCSNYGQYVNTGWTIHPSSYFEQIANLLKEVVNKGLKDGTIVYDISGTLMNHDTPSGNPVFLNAAMWDVLATPKMEMYGDIAIIKDSLGSEEIAEIRWYDWYSNKKRTKNLIINPKIINCMTEDAPYVENSVL